MSARERLAAQDAQLERLGAGVDRIRNLGETMHDETKQQLGLLDQLEGDVDKTTSGIREETKHAEDVAVSGQTFYMYVCIAILILVMVLELIIGLQLLGHPCSLNLDSYVSLVRQKCLEGPL